MKEKIALIFQELNISADVIVGGSHSIQMASHYSDREFYILVKTFQDLYQILRSKQHIEAKKKEYRIDADFLLTTKWLVKHKFFYILGVDEQGNELDYAYDARLMRNSSLKMGLRAFLDSQTEDDPLRKQYLLSKAAIQLVYSYSLQKNIPMRGQLFTPRGASKLISSLPDGFKSLHECVDLKFSDAIVDTRRYEALLRSLIEIVVTDFNTHPWCTRAYVWQLLFAVRYGKVGDILRYRDKEIIESLYAMVETNDLSAYKEIRSTILQTLVI